MVPPPAVPPAPAYPPPYPPPPGAPYPAPYAPPPPQATFWGLLSGTFNVWTENFVPLFVVYLVLSLVIGLVSLGASYAILGFPYVAGGGLGISPSTLPSTTDIALFLAFEVVIALVGWMLTSAVVGGVTDLAVRRHRGENVRIMDSLNRGFQRLLSVLGANLLVTLVTAGVFLLWAALLLLGVFAFATGGPTPAAIGLLCGLLALLPFVFLLVIYLVLALSLYAPAIMMEGAHAVDSLGRSWSLTRGHKWSIFWAGIIVGIALIVVNAIITGIVGPAANPVAYVVGEAVATAITGSWFTILAAVAYDLITRTPQPTAWPPTMTATPPPAYPPR